jgi:exodeoxyribonuclease V alpha subunit
MHIRNRAMKAWPSDGQAFDYVANGEIGLVAFGPPRSGFVRVAFSTQPQYTYTYQWGDNDLLELAYAITVHKSQGSDFDAVFFIIPQTHAYLSRELVYTGLTRFRKKLILLVEKDVSTLIRMRSPDSSATRLRNTHMFSVALRSGKNRPAYNEPLIHRTTKGVAVRSKSEVIVAEVLEELGLSYRYEQPLSSKSDAKDFRLPDFTISFEGDTYYWEHLGMLNVPAYQEAWERKQKWYVENGFSAQLLTSADGPNGGIDAEKIKQLARARILGES